MGPGRGAALYPHHGQQHAPLIWDGDHVLVAHGCAGLRRGDVVVFRRGGRLIAHRVLRIYGGNAGPTFVTKGDHAPQFDSPLSPVEGPALSPVQGPKSCRSNKPIVPNIVDTFSLTSGGHPSPSVGPDHIEGKRGPVGQGV